MGDHLEDTVTQALRRLDRQAPDAATDPARIRRAVRRRRAAIAAPVAVVLAVAGTLAGVVLAQPHGRSAAGPPVSACGPLQTGPPPVWARSGFTGNGYPPHATSRSGEVVAIVFGDPLSAPPSAGHNNKILWVARDGAAEMAVTAHLEGTDRVVTKEIPVGPSIVDMPAAGCWRMDLRIGARHDQIALRWTKP